MKRIVQILIAITFLSTLSKAQNVEWLVKPIYDVILPFYDGVAVVRRDDRWGYINEGGKEIIYPVNGHVYNFNENVGIITMDDNTITGIVDIKGNIIKPQKKLKIDPRFPVFSDGLLLVTDGKTWGYMNKNGELVIPCQYKFAKPFSEGLAGVALSEGWFYINTSSQPAIRCETNRVKWWVSGFTNGRAFVLYENELVCIDRSGNKINERLPFLKASSDYSSYFAKTLSCTGGEIIFDNKNRVVSINEKSGEINQYIELSQNTKINQGYFVVNGNEISYSSNSVFWNNQTMATITISEKKGIVLLTEKPLLKIDNPDNLTSVLGNPSELKLQLSNNSQQDLDAITFKIEGLKEILIDKIPKEEKKELIFSIPKETDFKVEVKNLALSISQYGLLLEKKKIAIQIRDSQALYVKFPENKSFTIEQGSKIKISIAIRNSSMYVAKNVSVKVNFDGDELSYKFLEIPANNLATIDGISISKSSSIEVSVICPKTPMIKKNESIRINVIPNETPKITSKTVKTDSKQDSKEF